MTPSSSLALLFDFDGLMVDTEYFIYEAWRDLYLSQGQDLPLSLYVKCVGSTFDSFDPMLELENRLGHKPDWSTLLAEKDRRIIAGQVKLDALPGVRELLQQCQAEGIATAVASSSTSTHVNGWLDRLDLAKYFTAICTRDQVERAKPAPDLFLLAMHRLGVGPSQCIVLEDSANGLRAATAASVACVIVPNRTTEGSDFSGAATILPSLAGQTPTSILGFRN